MTSRPSRFRARRADPGDDPSDGPAAMTAGAAGGLSERDTAVLRRLELDVTRRLDGLLHGDHAGWTTGHGSEPGEARPYVAGDDPRRIDWNVSARMSETHVRTQIADRELETWLAIDRSASMGFGTRRHEKHDLALAAAAAVGFLTSRGGNRFGTVIGGPEVSVVPARQGRRHVLAALQRIVTISPREGVGASLADVLTRSAVVARRRGALVVVSDFLDDPATWAGPLRTLALRHETVCVRISDPAEHELPAVGPLRLIDTETGVVREIDTSSRRVRETLATAIAERDRLIDATIRHAGAALVELRTDRDWLHDLARFLTTRKRRVNQHVRTAR